MYKYLFIFEDYETAIVNRELTVDEMSDIGGILVNIVNLLDNTQLSCEGEWVAIPIQE
jgi:hypothetical protein